MKITRRSSKAQLKTIELAGLVGVGILITAGLLIRSNGDSIHNNIVDDPTEHAVPVQLLNDTNSLLTAKQCQDESCKSYAEIQNLRSGDSAKVNGSDAGIAQPWRVFDSTGQIVGCLDLEFSSNAQKTVKLSTMSECKQ